MRIIGSIDGIDDDAALTDTNQDLDVMEASLELPDADIGVLRTKEHVLITDERTDVVPPHGQGWHILTPALRGIVVIK